jgi:hypothetical protein
MNLTCGISPLLKMFAKMVEGVPVLGEDQELAFALG